MRFSKSLFVAFAGLGLFACSNEDVTNGNGTINGPADVVVKLDLPNMSTGRALVDGGFTSDKDVTPNYVKVTLTYNGGKTDVKEGAYSSITKNNVVTFTNVNAPTQVDVEINTKSGSDNNWTEVAHGTFAQLQNITVAGTRMLGTTSTITADAKGNKYTCEVDMQHTMARLEFGGIKHETHNNPDKCMFKSGDLKGVMLNDVVMTENQTKTTYSEAQIDGFFSEAGDAGSWDKVTGANFLTSTTAWPADNKCIAYNIYPAAGAENLPTLTLYFSGLELADSYTGPMYVGSNGFASVAKYKISSDNYTSLSEDAKNALCGESASVNNGYYQVINFPAGYIYQVKSLTVADEDIKTDPHGKGQDLEATITVTPWTIVEGTVEWN